MQEIFNEAYEKRREELVHGLAGAISSKYSPTDLSRLVVPDQSRDDFLKVQGNNLPPESSVRLLLGNIRELVTPGHHYEKAYGTIPEGHGAVQELTRKTFDALYALNYLAILASAELYGQPISDGDLQDKAFANAVHMIAKVPDIIEMHRWNVFAHLKDPAIWSGAVRLNLNIPSERFKELKFSGTIDEAIKQGDREIFTKFLRGHQLGRAYPLHVENVDTNYDGPRALLLYYIGNQLASPFINPDYSGSPQPVSFLPETIHRLTRDLGLDAHPETILKYAEFIDHLRATVVLGATGVGGKGIHFYGGGIVLGGLSDKAVDRHPHLGDFVKIGTGTKFFGPMHIGDYSQFGVDGQLIGHIEFEGENQVGNWARIGSYYPGGNGSNHRPGKITFARGVSVGDHTLIINTDPEDLHIPLGYQIPADSYITGEHGKPKHIESHRGDSQKRSLEDEVSSAGKRFNNSH